MLLRLVDLIFTEMTLTKVHFMNLRNLPTTLNLYKAKRQLLDQLYFTTQFNVAFDSTVNRLPSDRHLETACKTKSHVKCWNCSALLQCERDKFFCLNCSYIQPPVKCVNYFQYLDLPLKYDINTELLAASFRKLQSKLHPDKFSNKSEPEQEHSAQQASIVNKAYRTLLEPLPRALYLLELHGKTISENEIHVDDQHFLNEIMQINESIVESESVLDLNRIAEAIRRTLQKLQSQFSQQFNAAIKKNDFNEAFQTASKMKYYATALGNVDKRLGYV